MDHIGNVTGRHQFVFFLSVSDILSQNISSVGLGSDYDGIETVPIGLEDVSTYPALVRVLTSF